MSNKKKDKASTIYVIVILSLILIGIAVLALLLIFKKTPEEQYALEKYKDPEKVEIYKETMKEKIWPNGMLHLKNNYEGKNDLDDFYIILKSYGDYTVSLSNKKIFTNKDTEEMISALRYDFRVSNPEKVLEFYKGKTLDNILTCSIDGDTMENERDGLVFNMTFDYNDGAEKILYKVKVLNRVYSDKFAEFTLLEQ